MPEAHSIVVTTRSCKRLEVTLRSLRPEEYPLCEHLQHLTWGKRFREQVPPSMMKINVERLGGVLAGAFTTQGRLLGFVYGMTGFREGRPFHWSHLLAVAKRYENISLGRELKLYQRGLLVPIGVKEVEWTFDPLESRNAHLNLTRLGARPVEYQRNVYGDGSASPRHRHVGTDRLVVRWNICDPMVEERILGHIAAATTSNCQVPIVNVDEKGSAIDPPFQLPDWPSLRVEIPANISAVKAKSPNQAKRWRAGTRYALESYIGRQYRIKDFIFDSASRRSFYVLHK